MRRALEERNGKALQDRFEAAVVAICGLGGLGSNIAISLARAGIGKLILIDFDKVDVSNLHRQQYKAAQVGQYKADALAENLREIVPNKYLIAASGMAGLGSANTIKTRKITKRFYLCGDEVCDVADDIGLVSSRVMLCAAHQAHMVLRILAKQYDA